MARSRQYADRVNVIKMVKVDGKWPFAKVVERNGRIVRDHVWVAGQDEHHPEGRYYLEWYELGRRRRKPVESFDLVLPAARAKSIEISAVRAGLLALPEPAAMVIEEPERLTMDKAIDEYLDYVRKHRSLRTFRTYRPVLNFHFRNSYVKTYVDEVDRSDILKFMGDLFDYGLAARTVYDRLVVVLQLFKRHGFKTLVERSDWPSYVETIRPIYEPEELAAMLECADADEAILIKFCLATGRRDREVRYVTWRDINFRNCVVRVTAKPTWKFKPKNYEERAGPVPAALIEQLRVLKEGRNATLARFAIGNRSSTERTGYLWFSQSAVSCGSKRTATPQVLRLVSSMVEAGQAFCVPGNHDVKLVKPLKGRDVQLTHGLADSMQQLEKETPEFRQQMAKFLDGLISQLRLR